MNTSVYYLVIATTITFAVIRLLRPSISLYERAFLALTICLLGYFGYDKHLQNKHSSLKTSDNVSSILSLVGETLNIDQTLFTLPIRKILESDQLLLKVLSALLKYVPYDKDNITNIIKELVRFYELYADVLLGIKKTVWINNLVDIRFNILRNIHYMFVGMPTQKHVKVFEYILLIVQSSTYKSLNVLKNKYGNTLFESPIANNIFDNSFELY